MEGESNADRAESESIDADAATAELPRSSLLRSPVSRAFARLVRVLRPLRLHQSGVLFIFHQHISGSCRQMFGIFFKKRRVRCPGGHTVEVFRDPNDAIPFFVNLIEAEARASADLGQSTKASASGKYHARITGLSKLVAPESEKILIQFKMIYQYYAESPCTREQWFQDRLDGLMRENWRFQDDKLRMETIVALCKIKGANSAEILAVFRETSFRLTESPIVSQGDQC